MRSLAPLLVMSLPFSILGNSLRLGISSASTRRCAFITTPASSTMATKRHWQSAGLHSDNGPTSPHSQRLKMSSAAGDSIASPDKEATPTTTDAQTESQPPEPLYLAEGLLAIHKPLTWTSNDVVAYIRGILTRDARNRGADKDSPQENANPKKKNKKRRKQLLKVGHGGTLDPLASGVLVLGVGSGTTKLQSYLDGDKHYVAVVELGYETSTLDCEGGVVKEMEWGHVTSVLEAGVDGATEGIKSVEGVLPKFQGKIQQVPPLYSAIRVDGKRLYEYARENKDNANEEGAESKENASLEDVEIPVREVEVYGLKAVSTLDENVIHSGVVSGKQYRDTMDSLKAAAAATAAAKAAAEATSEVENNIDDNGGKAEGDDGKGKKKSNKKRKNDKKTEIKFDEETVPTIQTTNGSLALPQFALQVQCGGGTYIRSLVRDVGYELDTVATMTGLVRTKQGPFMLKDALRKDEWTADKIYEMVKKNQERGIV